MESISEKLSPIDIKNKEFKKAVRGYAPKEVVDFLDEVARTWERVQRQERELLRQVEVLNQEIERWKSRESELDVVRAKAKEEADAIREQAAQQAASMMRDIDDRAGQVRRATEEWLASVIANLEETEKQRSNFFTALRSSLESHYRMMEEQEPTIPLTEQLTDFLKSRTGPTN